MVPAYRDMNFIRHCRKASGITLRPKCWLVSLQLFGELFGGCLTQCCHFGILGVGLSNKRGFVRFSNWKISKVGLREDGPLNDVGLGQNSF